MNIYPNPTRDSWTSLCQRPQIPADKLFTQVRNILQTVKEHGDKAVLDYTRRFDGAELDGILCSDDEIRMSDINVSAALKDDIRLAIKNISRFHMAQMHERKTVTTMPGVNCWREARPIEKVGLYIPGGTAPLFSSVLMLAVPAVLAGCSEIVLCSPPQKDGMLPPAIVWAAKEAGVTTICKAGGAQAVAAMAYGTESVPAVYKILGPGNQYVTAAKLLVSTENVAIDMPAGPSEVLVIADRYADPEYIAADLLSQAEHGVDSQVILLTDSPELPSAVNTAIQQQVMELPRSDIALKALENSKIILLRDLRECISFSNIYAPEHLILNCRDAEELLPDIMNAGSVFVGAYTPESAGDYASGTNHTLPTGGSARNYSGVSLDSYTKMITFQSLTAKGLTHIGPAIERMASQEGLEAHKQAVSRRLKKINTL